MKKTRQYQKGKHIYIKSGRNVEVRTVQPKKDPEMVFNDDCQEYYVDYFQFRTVNKELQIQFGKKIHGTEKIHLKRSINMGKKTAREMLKLLKNVLGQ